MASLTRLGFYKSPSERARAAWAPDGRHVLLSWRTGACAWDFSRPEAPPIVAIDVGPDAKIHGWSPSCASYFITRELQARTRNGLTTFVLEERRVVDGSLVRAKGLGPLERQHFEIYVDMSPDSHALVLRFLDGYPMPAIVVFD